MNSTIIKLLASEIGSDLTLLINESVSKSVFPIILKKANIIPVPKKATSVAAEDVRPISIQLNFLQSISNGSLETDRIVSFVN